MGIKLFNIALKCGQIFISVLIQTQKLITKNIQSKALVFRINHTIQQDKKLALIYTNLHASTGFVKIQTV